MGIYSYELFKFYGVENIIRLGSCGAYTKDLQLFDLVLVDNTYTESNYAFTMNNDDCHYISSNSFLNEKIENTAATEMECFSLFYNAHLLGKKASCILTVVDSHYYNEATSADQRQNSLDQMIKLGLDSAVCLD